MFLLLLMIFIVGFLGYMWGNNGNFFFWFCIVVKFVSVLFILEIGCDGYYFDLILFLVIFLNWFFIVNVYRFELMSWLMKYLL